MTRGTHDLEDVPGLAVEHRGGALWLTLSRPKSLNALTPAMVRDLGAALREADADDGIRAVVITGAGRAFCAGADIGGGHGDVESEAFRLRLLAFMESVCELTLAIERLSKPVIAAINGTTLAGGLELALACDLLFAAESAMIGDGHARYGLLPGGGSSVRLPRRLAPQKARWLLFTGELVPASDPMIAGLFTKVVPDGRLMVEVEACIALFARRSPLVTKRMKQLASASLEQPVEEALRAEREVNGMHFYSEDRREGLAAFRERREPKFQGR